MDDLYLSVYLCKQNLLKVNKESHNLPNSFPTCLPCRSIFKRDVEMLLKVPAFPRDLALKVASRVALLKRKEQGCPSISHRDCWPEPENSAISPYINRWMP